MTIKSVKAFVIAALISCATGQKCMPQSFPTWTPVPMITELDFPAPPGRAREGNPNGPFLYSLPGPNQFTIDTGCNYPSTPAIYINSTNVSGQPIYRGAQRADVSSFNSAYHGIDIKAAFLSSGNFGEVAFFHENPCYITGHEYGFARNAATNIMNFYVANNANCFPPNSGNTSCWNGSWLTSSSDIYQMPNVGPNSFHNYQYYYGAFVITDPNTKKIGFRLTIQDPGTFVYIFNQTFFPPTVPQSDLSDLASGYGYITTALQNGSASYNPGGNFQVYGVWIGR